MILKRVFPKLKLGENEKELGRNEKELGENEKELEEKGLYDCVTVPTPVRT